METLNVEERLDPQECSKTPLLGKHHPCACGSRGPPERRSVKRVPRGMPIHIPIVKENLTPKEETL